MTAIVGAVQIVPPDINMEPPGATPFSITTGRAPAPTALAAAHSPAMPAPHTRTSTSSSNITAGLPHSEFAAVYCRQSGDTV